MKTQIRRGAFETNSSSTHAINIFRGSNYSIPESVTIVPGEFGWENEDYDHYEDKLSYLYTWILAKCHSYTFNNATGQYEDHYDYKKLKDYQYRIKSKLEQADVKEVIFEKNNSEWYEDGYIDHSEDLFDDDLEAILENYFLDFVFNPTSYIETGNDNSDYDVDTNPSADFTIYKGN